MCGVDRADLVDEKRSEQQHDAANDQNDIYAQANVQALAAQTRNHRDRQARTGTAFKGVILKIFVDVAHLVRQVGSVQQHATLGQNKENPPQRLVARVALPDHVLPHKGNRDEIDKR